MEPETAFGLAARAGSSGFGSTRNRIAMTYLMAGKLRLDLPTRNSEEPQKATTTIPIRVNIPPSVVSNILFPQWSKGLFRHSFGKIVLYRCVGTIDKRNSTTYNVPC